MGEDSPVCLWPDPFALVITPKGCGGNQEAARKDKVLGAEGSVIFLKVLGSLEHIAARPAPLARRSIALSNAGAVHFLGKWSMPFLKKWFSELRTNLRVQRTWRPFSSPPGRYSLGRWVD